MFKLAFFKHTSTGCLRNRRKRWLRTPLGGRGGELREKQSPQIICKVDNSWEESGPTLVNYYIPSTPSDLKSSRGLSKFLPLLEGTSIVSGKIGFNIK
jgi:hypothetical protein